MTFYDTYTVEGSQTPFDGNIAEKRVYTSPSTYVSSGRSTYDNTGRLLTSTDPAGLTTTTTYSPAVNWPDNGITSTIGGGFNHTTTTLIDRHTGQPSRITDPNSKITDFVYDQLGRIAEVYLPGQAKSSGVPSLRFSYQISSSGIGQPTAPARTRTETLQSHSGSPVYLNSYQYVDGLGRIREAQQPGPNGGRIVTATTYDARGNASATTSPFHNSSAAGSGLVNPNLTTVPAVHEASYDHLNRATTQVDKKLGTAWRQTATTYHGDRVTVIPPTGSTKTVRHADVRGNVTRLDQYTSATNPNTFQSTTYTYDLLNQLTKVVDSAGNTWTNTYDLAGRLTQKVDPDAGTSTTHYDSAGRLAYTIDGRGQKISTEYDTMSRAKGRWSGDVGSGTRLASYVYDTLAKGYLTSSTRHHGGSDYTTAVTGYTNSYQPTGTTVTIPAAEGALAGIYGNMFTYDKAGHLTSSSQPAAGGLPAETLTFGYDNNGYPTTMTGAATYIAATSYYANGPTHQLLLGATGKRVRLTNTIDQQTGRLDATSIDLESTPGTFTTKYGTAYRYDPIGNITSILGSTNGTADQIECFRYDPLRRLTTAWTGNTPATTACDQTPQRGGSIDPYWRSWEFDTVGNRTTQTDHNTAGNTTWTYTHPNPGASRPHALTTVTATGPLAASSTRSFTYDTGGYNLTRHTDTGVAQQLEWNAEGRLHTLTEGAETTSYIYDTEGNRLISRASDKTTLYLGATELTLNAGATQTGGTRYYSAAGRTIAVRTQAGLVWSGGDHQGTEQIQINADDLTTNRKRRLPYGENRTTPPSIFLGTRGFVGGTQDDTGLTHLGAREYDPTLGRFMSIDPIMDLADPQQMHGYAYANNSPATYSDPSGLYFEEGSHGGGQRGYVTKTSSGKNQVKVAGKSVAVGCSSFKSCEREADRSSSWGKAPIAPKQKSKFLPALNKLLPSNCSNGSDSKSGCGGPAMWMLDAVRYGVEAGVDPRLVLSVLMAEVANSEDWGFFERPLQRASVVADWLGIYGPLKSFVGNVTGFKDGEGSNPPSIGWGNIQKQTFENVKKNHPEALGAVGWTDLIGDNSLAIRVTAYALADNQALAERTAPASMRRTWTPEQVAAGIYNIGEDNYAAAVGRGGFGPVGSTYASTIGRYMQRSDALICGSGVYSC
ncbi:RHS repeat-associated core domain-containing protein [Verrucosispora sp. ts21]|uniref:RHS repeat domain-containing protein n=1 Tax=Verrucosispora sp. ts21 TaxID=2069341 RepID=UPI0026CA6DD1